MHIRVLERCVVWYMLLKSADRLPTFDFYVFLLLTIKATGNNTLYLGKHKQDQMRLSSSLHLVGLPFLPCSDKKRVQIQAGSAPEPWIYLLRMNGKVGAGSMVSVIVGGYCLDSIRQRDLIYLDLISFAG